MLRYHVADRVAVDERLRAEIAWVSWPPWGDRQSSRADLMRSAYRATHTYTVMVCLPQG